MIIGFIKKQQFTKKQPIIVSDSVNYLSAKFVFQTSEWDEMIKFAHFQSGDDVYDFLLDGDELPKEASLNLYAGNWKVYIHGDRYVVGNDGNAKVVERATTNSQEIKVVKYEKEGSVLPEISFDVAEQIAAVAEDAKRIATSVRNEADQGMFDGVSVTHEWEGTALKVTSASGTSSADLKGQKGDKGEPGKDGYTPQKNVDYFDGKDGADGKDGISPHIGENGNWWIGEIDTGVKAGGVNSWYDLSDRPFGDVETEKTVVDEKVKFNQSGQSTNHTFFPLVVGSKYKVTFDGIEYETIAKERAEDLYGDGNTIVDVRYIGNIDENENEEPFCYHYLTVDPQTYVAWTSKSKKGTQVPVKVTLVTETAQPIDIKYLPEQLQIGAETVPFNEVLPETTVEGEGDLPLTAPLNLIAGQKYLVKWNGIEYSSVAVELSENGKTIYCLGDVYTLTGGAIGTAPTGEPFVIMDMGMEIAEGVYGIIRPIDGATTVTLSIIGGGYEIIKKLDNKYLDLEWLPTPTEAEKTIIDEDFRIGTSGASTTATFFPLVEGRKYKVIFDGVEYEIIAKAITGDLAGNGNILTQVYIGNLDAIENDIVDEEPFYYGYITVIPNDSYAWRSYPKRGTTVSVKVFEPVEAREPIPVEYLPKSVPYVLEGEEGIVEAWPETTYEFEVGDTMLDVLIDEAIYNAIFPNETYIVNWNGTEYECVGTDASALGSEVQGAFLGNIGVLTGGADTGEPFVIGVALIDTGDETQYVGTIVSADGSTSVTLSVSKGQLAKIQKLDERCLPETVATKAYVEELLGVIENGTY